MKMEERTTLENPEMMEEIVIDFGDICRFCLAETDSTISIHDQCFLGETKENGDTICDFVAKLTSIEVENTSNFPSLVCNRCFEAVQVCYNFTESCRQSDFSLRDCYSKTLKKAQDEILSNPSCDIAIKEEIDCDSVAIKEEFEDVKEMPTIEIKKQDKILTRSSTNPKLITKKSDRSDKNEVKSKSIFKPKEETNLVSTENTTQTHQKVTTLSERLKEAQTKLADDIVRSQLIKSRIPNETTSSSQYHCLECSLEFSTPENLNKHCLTKHNFGKTTILAKEIEHSCTICKKNFLHKEKLLDHYNTTHKNGEVKEMSERRKYLCTHCKPARSFERQDCAIRHLKNVHDKGVEDLKSYTSKVVAESKCFRCNRCKNLSAFSTRYSVIRHLMNVHKMKREEIFENEWTVQNRDEVITPKEVQEVDTKVNETVKDLKLLKVYVCTDCSPPTSFSIVTMFIKHKADVHNKKLENISVKELSPVYVNSVNIFENGDEEDSLKQDTFKVVCKNCTPPMEFLSASDFVHHMKLCHKDITNWDIDAKILFGSATSLCETELVDNDSERRIWKCTECPAAYIRKHSLNVHLKEKHSKMSKLGLIKCPEEDCDEYFNTNKQVIQHGLTVHEKYFADLHKIFKKKILKESEEPDKRARNFECDICQKKYLLKTSLKRHIFKFHLGGSVNEQEEDGSICPYCGKQVSSKLNLKSHIEFVHEAIFVTCPICKKNINFKTLGKHYQTHQNENCEESEKTQQKVLTFLCNVCGKILRSKASLADHQKLHKNERDHICDICGSGYTTLRNLRMHKKSHDLSQRKVFECDQCDKSFFGKHTLNRHLLTHSGEKNFICEMCSKTFYTLAELKRHLRYHKKEYRFDCQICDMRFLDKSRFRHHMMRHRNIRPHKCHFCDKVFIIRRKMHLHMSARHNFEVGCTGKRGWKDPKTYVPLDALL